MNVQIERLENHSAKLTVEIDPTQLDKAKQKAAQNLSKRLKIPGFRPGKAPYRVIVNYVGEGAILEDAVELLGNEIYPEVVKQSGVDPYGNGEISNVNIESEPPTIEYTVALQPEVDLGDYRNVRVPYTPAEIDDAALERALKELQEQHAIVEQSYRPVERGNRVTVDIHSVFVDEVAENTDESEAEASTEAAEAQASEPETVEHTAEEHDHDHDHEEGHDHEHGHNHTSGEEFIHEHDFQMILDEDGEPLPGFIDALVGAAENETRSFHLTVPDDKEKYEDSAGREVHFDVTVKKIENITLPALNDDFAARVTANREKPLSLLEMRVDLREALQKSNEERYRSDYVVEMLDAIKAQGSIKYPRAVVVEQINSFLNDFDQRLRQQGLTLKDYIRLSNRSLESIAADFEPSAIRTVERGLLARTIGAKEGVTVSAENIEDEVKRIVESYDEAQRHSVQQLFARPEMRDSIANDLLMSRLYDRIIAIGKGDDLPPLESIQTTEAEESKGETA